MMILRMKCPSINFRLTTFYTVSTLTLVSFVLSATEAKLISKHYYKSKVGNFFQNFTRLRDRRSNIEKDGYFTNTWAVELDEPAEEKDVARIAEKHGFTLLGKIGSLRNHYHLRHDDVRELHHEHAKEKTDLLMLEKEVKSATQQKYIHRDKRDGVPTDPKFSEMWYLLNTGQTGGPVGVDTNVLPVWKSGITGKGVVVAVLDDGLDHTHPDLSPNYAAEASYDFNSHDADPAPRDEDPDNCHGTRCAGEIVAVANNSICGAGVAYNAKVGGVRMLDGKATDALEASGLSFKRNGIDIYVNCWGPKDDGKTFGKPGPLAAKALKEGAQLGRNGKGNIYVWATGNGGLTDDDCNCDGYTTSIYTISIGCISDHGLSTYYTELCASTLAVTFNGGAHREREENKMITTDLFHKCTEEFKGTSSAAPIAAGMFSLVLEANPKLAWRDIQHLIVETAQMTSPVDEGWMKNGAGKHFNHKFGFGRMDAAKMVEAAKTWTNVAPQRICIGKVFDEQRDIPSAGSMEFEFASDRCEGGENQVDKVEHVVLTVSFIHRRRGDLSLLLISPSGTKSELLSTRRYDDSKEGLDDWNFMTVHFWGENPKGMWKVKVTDSPLDDNGQRVVTGYGTLHADTSKQEHDVEDLEQQVIDDQTKQQQNLVEQMKNKDPHLDFPYPSGVRRNNVNSTESPSALPQYSSNFNYQGPTSTQSIKRQHVPGFAVDSRDGQGEDKIKKDFISDQMSSPSDAASNGVSSLAGSRKDNIRKVQVATEEKATQRVQRFFQLMPSRASLWNLESFLDKSSVIGNDMSLFIRRYSSYLRQKTRSYAEMNYDFCRLVRGPSGVLRTLDTSGLLKTVIEIQILLDMLLEVDLQSSEFSNGIINSAFVLLFKDIIKLFACYNDAMINMLEKYYDMSKDHCKESLELYKKFVTRIDSVKKFLKVAQDVGVSKDAIPEMVEAPSSLLSALENHYQSLLKGQVPTSSAKQPSLAPIIIPPVSEQVHLNEGENETVESPEEIKEPSEPKTLLQTTDTAQSASEDPWQTLFEPERQPLRNTTPKTNQDDLLELHDVFQAHQASTAAYPVNPIFGGAGPGPIPLGPTGISTSLQPVSGFSQPNSWRQNGVARNNDPFEANAGVGPQIGSDILQPMNRPQQQRATQPVAEAPKGDLNSTLTKVVNSLDNFDLTSSTGVVGSTGSGHQWELPKPKIKTGGADFHMSATSGVTLPPTNPVSSGLPMPSTRFTLPPTAPATGIAHQQQMIRPVFTRPATFGVQPAAYGQQSAMRPQASVFPQQNVRPTNPFDNPVPGN